MRMLLLLVSTRIIPCLCLNSQSTDNANRRQSLASESISADRLQVAVSLQLAGGEAFAKYRKILLQDSSAIVRDREGFDATGLDCHLDCLRLSVQAEKS